MRIAPTAGYHLSSDAWPDEQLGFDWSEVAQAVGSAAQQYEQYKAQQAAQQNALAQQQLQMQYMLAQTQAKGTVGNIPTIAWLAIAGVAAAFLLSGRRGRR
jgi:multidrug efflux pump subunit AcrA (membrane-fusion protein)